MLYVLVHRSFEGPDRPIVEHRFFGETPDQAHAVFAKHMMTDEFLRDCENLSRWHDVRCTTTAHLEERDDWGAVPSDHYGGGQP